MDDIDYQDKLFEFMNDLTPMALQILKDSWASNGNEAVINSPDRLVAAVKIYLPILGDAAFKNPEKYADKKILKELFS